MYVFITTLIGPAFERATDRTVEARNGKGSGVLRDTGVPAAMQDNPGAFNPKRARQPLQAAPDCAV